MHLKERCPQVSVPSLQLSALRLALQPRSAEALRLRRQLQQKDLAALRTAIWHQKGRGFPHVPSFPWIFPIVSPFRTLEDRPFEVQTVLQKVLEQPGEQRLRRLRKSNLRVATELLAHPEAVALLLLAGWEQISGDLVLRSQELRPLREVLQSL